MQMFGHILHSENSVFATANCCINLTCKDIDYAVTFRNATPCIKLHGDIATYCDFKIA